MCLSHMFINVENDFEKEKSSAYGNIFRKNNSPVDICFAIFIKFLDLGPEFIIKKMLYQNFPL